MTAQRIKLLLIFVFLGSFLFSVKQAQAVCPQVQVGCNGYGSYCPGGETPCHDEWQCDWYYPQNCGMVCTDSQPCHNDWVCVGGWYGRDCWNWVGDGWELQQCYDCSAWDVQCVGGGCFQEAWQCSGGGCGGGHTACVGGGCPVSWQQYCTDPVYGPDPSCSNAPLPSPCAGVCINASGESYPMPNCNPSECDNNFPTAPAPGCTQIGEPYPISEPGKCARNCISQDGITNIWDYVDCAPGTNPPPAQNCPAYCGYAGGTVNDGVGGQKVCPSTAACPVASGGGGGGGGGGGEGGGLGPLPTPNPIATGSFFQVLDSGAMAQSGGIRNLMPVGTTLSKGVAGVIIGNGASNFGSGHASNTNWVAGSDLDNTGVISGKLNYRYDYDYVSGRIISTIKPADGPNSVGSVDALKVGTPEKGVYYVLVTGNLDITSNLDFGTSKVVVLVTGDANINGKINFTKNQGLFALYVKGNINIDPSVGAPGVGIDPTGLPAHLEGLYLAQGSINTGVAASQLRLEGAFVGIGGVNLQRNLNSAWPSEYFVFRPDILMNLPKQLLRQNHLWQELAP